MTSTNRPLTLMGKQLRTPSSPRKFTYRTKSYSSDVDETLFGTPSRFSQQVETKHMSDGKEWDPPWVTSPTKRGAPLLWTPFEYKGPPERMITTSKSQTRPTTPQRSSKTYRMRNHTPTFVDETLFGNRPQEPSFRAPWEDKSSLTTKHLLWAPEIIGTTPPLSPRSDTSSDDRPKSRLGEYNDPYIPPTPRDATHPAVTPVIKRRPGSGIKTSIGNSSRHSEDTKIRKSQADADAKFDEKEELIEKALRLARQAQEASLQQDSPSSRRQAWSKHALGQSRESSPRNSSGFKPPRLSGLGSRDEGGPLSATGVRVPLSARSSRSESTDHFSPVRTRSQSAYRAPSVDAGSAHAWKP